MIETARVALKGLAANKLRSGLTIRGLTIGVGSVIVLIAVGTGSSSAVESKIDSLGTNLLTVTSTSGVGTSTALLAVALGFAGFCAGAREEKATATGSGATRSASGAAATPSTSTGSQPAAGAPRTAIGSSSGLATGTVTRVDGDTVYIKSASGNTVHVRLLPTTTVSKSLSVSGHMVRPGDTVSIQGAEGRGNTIKPTSITAPTAPARVSALLSASRG